ncbi:uncharacterized protein LOC134359833 isoform X2 [Mobula hypostoma]
MILSPARMESMQGAGRIPTWDHSPRSLVRMPLYQWPAHLMTMERANVGGHSVNHCTKGGCKVHQQKRKHTRIDMGAVDNSDLMENGRESTEEHLEKFLKRSFAAVITAWSGTFRRVGLKIPGLACFGRPRKRSNRSDRDAAQYSVSES